MIVMGVVMAQNGSDLAAAVLGNYALMAGAGLSFLIPFILFVAYIIGRLNSRRQRKT